MVLGLPRRQLLFLVMLYVLSFATFYWAFYELGFPSALPVLVIEIAAAFGFTFLMYNLIFRLSRTVYVGQFDHTEKKAPEIKDVCDTEPSEDERKELNEIIDRGSS